MACLVSFWFIDIVYSYDSHFRGPEISANRVLRVGVAETAA